MINKIDREILNRFSKGKASAEEEIYIYSLFTENEGHQEFERYIQNEFNEYLKDHPDEDNNLSYLLDRIHHSINDKQNQNNDSIVKRIYRWYTVAAAVLLIPLLVGGGFLFTKQKTQDPILAENPVTSTLFAPLGSRVSFSLPDGTIGWLNSGSSLKYSIPFNGNRQVAVLGEAWFDVAHDVNHPFEVSIGNSKVEVMGTKFNINAYPEEKYLEVVLEEGKVKFSTLGLSEGIYMKPAERLVLSDGAININLTDASKYTGWKNGKLIFRGDPMEEVAQRIGRWYNVDVELVDKELKSHIIRGTFQDDSLQELLRYLSMTSPIRYRIVERIVLADGTIQKKKVLLYQKNIKQSN